MKHPFFLVFASIFLPVLLVSFSQDAYDIDEYSYEISLVVGEIHVLSVSSPYRVSVRNPRVLDIGKVTDAEVVVIAKQKGSTVLQVWDQDGEKEFYIAVYSQDLARLKENLKNLLQDSLGIYTVSFRSNEVTGEVMLIGEVTQAQKDQIEKAIANVFSPTANQDNLLQIVDLTTIKPESKMVEIECRILELTKSFTENLGLDWPSSSGAALVEYHEVMGPAADTGGKLLDTLHVIDWRRSALSFQLKLAESEGRAKLLARPKIMCLSGQRAEFLVGGEIPIVSASVIEGDVVTEEVEWKEYGIKVYVEPEIMNEEDLQLQIETEVKELTSEGQYERADGTVIKAFLTRRSDTHLFLKSGQGIILSGLLTDRVTKDDLKSVPGLGDLPILGALFRSKDYQDSQTELVISLTPRVIDVKKEEINTEETRAIAKASTLPTKPVVYPDYLQKEASLTHYILRIQKIIFNSLDYPRLAKEAGWQGVVKLRLHLKYDGELIDARVGESSGYSYFDKGVVSAAKSLSPYPPFPPDIELDDLWIDIPIVYKMN